LDELKTTDFDKFGSPVDTLARIVTSPKKPEYEYETTYKHHWKSPPPMIPMPTNFKWGSNPVRVGEVYGRFTVIGAHSYGGSRMRYVVRCTCGDYEIRTAYDMRRNKPRAHHMNACFNCMKLDNLKNGSK
jgi:hypothetical protein